jgi:hypothetical protein
MQTQRHRMSYKIITVLFIAAFSSWRNPAAIASLSPPSPATDGFIAERAAMPMMTATPQPSPSSQQQPIRQQQGSGSGLAWEQLAFSSTGSNELFVQAKLAKLLREFEARMKQEGVSTAGIAAALGAAAPLVEADLADRSAPRHPAAVCARPEQQPEEEPSVFFGPVFDAFAASAARNATEAAQMLAMQQAMQQAPAADQCPAQAAASAAPVQQQQQCALPSLQELLVCRGQQAASDAAFVAQFPEVAAYMQADSELDRLTDSAFAAAAWMAPAFQMVQVSMWGGDQQRFVSLAYACSHTQLVPANPALTCVCVLACPLCCCCCCCCCMQDTAANLAPALADLKATTGAVIMRLAQAQVGSSSKYS